MNLEILVATMGQDDLSLPQRMNIRSAAVIANQHDRYSVEESATEYGRVKMITTPTRGVGLNRNIALMASEADILLFADDDVKYYDDTAKNVIAAFESLPDADVICFGLDITKNGELIDGKHYEVKRLHLFNSMRYGGPKIAIRRRAVAEHRLSFTTLFGGGCIYGSGEDSLFIRDCIKAGLKVYSHSVVLGGCAKDTSSWFTGYNEKYLYDRGAWMACAFPKLKHIIKWYFIVRFSKKCGIPFGRTAKIISRGIAGFKTLTPYAEVKDSI